MGDSPLVPVSKIADIVLGGTPKRSEEAYWGGSIKWASAKDITSVNTRYIYDTEERITETGLEESNTKLLPKDTIVITARGTVGAMAMLSEDMAFNQSCYGLISKDGIDSDYLFYALKASLSKISSVSYGTVFDTITMKSFDSIEIPVPSIEEQKRIAHILGTLDDKIELNQRMNETLEAIARAIFKSWFVDFDPVKAKMAGESYPLPDEIMALFPDELVESELGLIPKGWEVGKLEDLAEKVENGGTPKKSEPLFWTKGDIPWLTSGEVRQNLISSTDNFITELGLKNSSAKIWGPGTTIVALYGATAGEVTMSNIKLTANQACCGLSPKENCQYYLYLTASRATDLLANQARGSAQQNLSQGIVKNFKCIIPSPDTLIKFKNLINPIYEKISIILEEIAILIKLRDTLLENLISEKNKFWSKDE